MDSTLSISVNERGFPTNMRGRAAGVQRNQYCIDIFGALVDTGATIGARG